MTTDWQKEIKIILKNFPKIEKLAGSPMRKEMTVEYLTAPHKPPRHLPNGKMAIYGFMYKGKWLKIGKAGPKSNARYTSQHYNLKSTKSTIAASIINDRQSSQFKGLNKDNPGEWIKANTNRINILMDYNTKSDLHLLALFEAYMHIKLKPCYEGYTNDKTLVNK